MKVTLEIKNLHAHIAGNHVLQGINLIVNSGEIHAIMGPNGAGKSSLALSLMGHPNYSIQYKVLSIKYKSNILELGTMIPDDRAKAGVFISFQSPLEINGVSVLAFLRTAYKSLYPQDKKPLSLFKKEVLAALHTVGLDDFFMQRSVNEGFSGGEKKRLEVAQLLLLKPRFVVFDEIDSGLDVDSLKIIAMAIRKLVKENNTGVILITHYQRILHHIKPNKVHVLMDGKIIKTDGMKLVRTIEKGGYAAV